MNISLDFVPDTIIMLELVASEWEDGYLTLKIISIWGDERLYEYTKLHFDVIVEKECPSKKCLLFIKKSGLVYKIFPLE